MTDRQIEAGLIALSKLEAGAVTGTAQMICVALRAVLDAMLEAGKGEDEN